MDYVLSACDDYFLTPHVYPINWSEDSISRQSISLFLIGFIGGIFMYLIPATLGYLFLFDHRLLNHPLILKNQIRREIRCALTSIPFMSLLTNPLFVLEVRGYSRLYDHVHDIKLGWYGVIVNAITFILFTDFLIYWFHRWLHSKSLYKPLHKMHHTWKIPTPFASHAFHPVDGVIQSLPYHIYIFLFPMHKLSYLLLFVFVNIWTVSIHDSNCKVPFYLRSVINGSAHHTDHHTLYSYNYGQFFTLWDRIGGSYRNPSIFEGKGPLEEVLKKKT
ncbi:Lathosterol oxidase [Chamberlinius hualienensis]